MDRYLDFLGLPKPAERFGDDLIIDGLRRLWALEPEVPADASTTTVQDDRLRPVVKLGAACC
jgi:hypothetical protein